MINVHLGFRTSVCIYQDLSCLFLSLHVLNAKMTQTANGNGNGNGNGHSQVDKTDLTESPLYTVPPGHLLLHLSSNKTAAFSLPSYPAASFYLYVPNSHPVCRRKRGESSSPVPLKNHNGPNGESNGHTHETNGYHLAGNGNGIRYRHGDHERRYPLVVCMHGSSRDAEGVRNRWADLAEREGFVVLAPLFPVDINVSPFRVRWEAVDLRQEHIG